MLLPHSHFPCLLATQGNDDMGLYVGAVFALAIIVRVVMRFFKALKQNENTGNFYQPSTPPRPNAPVHNQPPLPPAPLPAAPRPPATRPQAPQRQPLSQLTGGEFQPLSAEEVRKRASTMERQSGWGFDDQSVIPSAEDARTKLIDQGMVGLGIISPEALVEIHSVGVEMDELRPRIAQAHQQANSAVQQAKEAKDQLKAQKKAEAAQRKAERAAAIAQRRETDIVFLGRGVSGGLADRRANVERLQKFGLPVLATPADLAKALSLTPRRLRWLSFHAETAVVTHYVRFQVPKKSGGMRELAAPLADLATAQKWILTHILEKLPMPEAAHGFIKGRSTMSNAVPHVRQSLVVNLDLKDFFPTITFPRVKGIFQGLGFSPAVSTILGLLCTECPRRVVTYNGQKLHVATGARALPQGACTSPALSNLCARRLDARLTGLAQKHGWTYTRYADDLTFSSREPQAPVGRLLAHVRYLTTEEHFTVNETKTRMQRPNACQTVTGIVVNQRPNIPRHERRRLRAILHQAGKTGLAEQNRDQHPHFEGWVSGMISYIKMVNPDLGGKLRSAWAALRKG